VLQPLLLGLEIKGDKLAKIFVFGTLKEGFPNYKFNKGIRFRKEFKTKERFPLYLVGEQHSPWLILQQNEGTSVRGQVFDVSPEALAEMDRLERITEPDGYRRIELDVLCADSSDEFKVFAYSKPEEQLQGADVKIKLSNEYTMEHAELYRSLNYRDGHN
jgi:gamma-glutamylaminecyclotransferase